MTALSPQHYADRILKAIDKVAPAYLAVASACAEADGKLDETQKEELFKLIDTKMNESTFSKFVQIGNCKRLYADDFRSHLPLNGYSVLYEVALLTDEQIDKAVAEKVIKPSVKRSELTDWRNKQNNKTPPTPVPPLPERFFVGIRLTGEMTPEQAADLNNQLVGLTVMFPIALDRPPDKRAGAVSKAWNHMRKTVRKMVSEFKKRKREELGKRRKGESYASYYGFHKEELEVGPDADEERLQEVLQHILRHDEFDRIRQEAYDTIELPAMGGHDPTPEGQAEGLAALERQIDERKTKQTAIDRLRKVAKRKRRKPDASIQPTA